MRINSNAEAALHLAVLLAALPPDRGLPSNRLAEFHALSPSSMAKLLQQLAAAGIVASAEGRSGGYRLARAPADVSVLELLDAAEAVSPSFACLEIRRRGPSASRPASYSARCSIASLMDSAEDAWRAALSGVSLAELSRRVRRDLSAPVSAKAAEWIRSTAR